MGVTSRDISAMPDPIDFIKNDPGIIFRLKALRVMTNIHVQQAIATKNRAREVIELIGQEVGQ